MAVVWTEQHRGISDRETDVEDGASVRAIRDMADSLNNWARWGMREKVISEICIPKWYSADSADTNENVLAVFAPRLIPHGFTKFSVTMGHERSVGAGVDTVVFALYASSQIYLGDEILDTAALSVDYSRTLITNSSGTHAITVTQDLVIPAQANIASGIYFILTGENTINTRACLTSIDVTPIYI